MTSLSVYRRSPATVALAKVAKPLAVGFRYRGRQIVQIYYCSRTPNAVLRSRDAKPYRQSILPKNIVNLRSLLLIATPFITDYSLLTLLNACCLLLQALHSLQVPLIRTWTVLAIKPSGNSMRGEMTSSRQMVFPQLLHTKCTWSS